MIHLERFNMELKMELSFKNFTFAEYTIDILIRQCICIQLTNKKTLNPLKSFLHFIKGVERKALKNVF